MNRDDIDNNKEGVPFEEYRRRLAEADPADIEERTGIALAGGKFAISLMGTEYRISWPDYAIESDDEGAFALTKLPAQTYLIRHLLEGKRALPSGKFLTFREMPWGELYIRPFTDRCIKRAAFTFGPRLDKFREAVPKFGRAISGADAGAEFELMRGYFMRLLIWEGDDEFPPNSQILFSDNFADSMSAEDRVVSCDLALSIINKKV